MFGVAAKGASQGCVRPTYFRPIILNSHYIMYGFQKSTLPFPPPVLTPPHPVPLRARYVAQVPGKGILVGFRGTKQWYNWVQNLAFPLQQLGWRVKRSDFFFLVKHYCIYRFHQQLLASHVINGRLRSISTTPSRSNRPGIPADVYVHRGFLSSYSDIRSEMLDYIGQAISACSWCDITVVGHSLGAAQAALFVADIKNNATMQRNVR